jgi:hypothetical protein
MSCNPTASAHGITHGLNGFFLSYDSLMQFIFQFKQFFFRLEAFS